MRTYVIINSDEVSSVNFNEVVETSANTIRYSLDGSKTFVKFEGEQPSFLNGKQEYNHSEILAILATNEWTDENIF
tara:strand:- start:1015 stop:1242 length:228 start_codon:yes stop_codon:yes gene_type:complete